LNILRFTEEIWESALLRMSVFYSNRRSMQEGSLASGLDLILRHQK